MGTGEYRADRREVSRADRGDRLRAAGHPAGRAACACEQLEEGRAEVENQYARSVRPEGNPPALRQIAEVFRGGAAEVAGHRRDSRQRLGPARGLRRVRRRAPLRRRRRSRPRSRPSASPARCCKATRSRTSARPSACAARRTGRWARRWSRPKGPARPITVIAARRMNAERKWERSEPTQFPEVRLALTHPTRTCRLNQPTRPCPTPPRILLSLPLAADRSRHGAIGPRRRRAADAAT